MSSSKASEVLDLERVLSVTEADVKALGRPSPRIDFGAYLKALAQLPPPSLEALRRRSGPASGPAFRLP
jgi:hypothetical protein